jgi:Antirestriction protein (ArdA)
MNERFPNINAHNINRTEQEQALSDGDLRRYEDETSHERDALRYPRIYVTAGLPLRAELTRGTWLEMARDPDYIYAELHAVLGEPYEHDADRFYIWDHQGFGAFNVSTGAIGLDDVHSIELLSKVANGVVDHGPAYAAWASAHEDDPRLFDHFATAYKGHHESMAAYVRQLFEPLKIEAKLKQTVPQTLADFVYVDYAAIGEEMLQDGDIVAFPADGSGVWIFDERA